MTHGTIALVFTLNQGTLLTPHILAALVDAMGGEYESVPLYWHKGGVNTLSVAFGGSYLNSLRGRSAVQCRVGVYRYWMDM